VLWTLMGVTAVVGYLFRYGTGNKLLEQPLPHKIVIVICMLLFLYNIGMTIWKSKRFTTTEGVLVLGLGLAAVLYLPALLEFENYTVAIFYRWWTIHLWVEGVWEMIQGGFLAYLLIRLSGADREVMEKWLYVIVGLVFIAGILGTAHHYYWVGVPPYWLPIGGIFSALEPLRWWEWRCTRTRRCVARACRTPTRWHCTGRWAAPCSPCSAQACSGWPTPSRTSTSGPMAR
jgi:nitric oxide reductase subunit B